MPTFLQRSSSIPWPPLLFAGTFCLCIASNWLMPARLPGGRFAEITGIVLAAAALLLDAGAALTLARNKTTVLPHRGSDALVTTGPFAFSRNPIYLGNILLTAGLGLALANAWLLAGAAVEACLLRWLAILPEERHLEARFGDAWRAYQARTARWIGIRMPRGQHPA